LRYNVAAESFYIMKLCSRLFVFIVEIVEKTTNLGTLSPFQEVRGGIEPWLMALRVEFLLSVNELLLLSLTAEALQGKMCQNLLPSGGVGHLPPRFLGEGFVPSHYIDTTRKAVDCATTLPLTVFI